jgi:hypothetical protein
MTTYAFTGPHTVGEEYRPYIRDCLSLLDAPACIVTGCAFGIDTLVAEEALDLFPEARHVLVIPDGAHNSMLVERFAARLDVDVELVTHYPRNPQAAYRGRNEEMVRRCDVLIAFPLSRTSVRGGTWMTINIARRASRVVVLFPLTDATLRVEEAS